MGRVATGALTGGTSGHITQVPLCSVRAPIVMATGLASRLCACCCSGLCWARGWRLGNRRTPGNGLMSWLAAMMLLPRCRRRMPTSGPSAVIARCCCPLRRFPLRLRYCHPGLWRSPLFLPSPHPPCRRQGCFPVRSLAPHLVRSETSLPCAARSPPCLPFSIAAPYAVAAML